MKEMQNIELSGNRRLKWPTQITEKEYEREDISTYYIFIYINIYNGVLDKLYLSSIFL